MAARYLINSIPKTAAKTLPSLLSLSFFHTTDTGIYKAFISPPEFVHNYGYTGELKEP